MNIWFHVSKFGNSDDYSVPDWEVAKKEAAALVRQDLHYCCDTELEYKIDLVLDGDDWREAVEMFNLANAVGHSILMREGERVYG